MTSTAAARSVPGHDEHTPAWNGQIARFATSDLASAAPPAVLEWAGWHITDTIGVLVAGLDTTAARLVQQTLGVDPQVAPARSGGHARRRLSPADAANINGTLSHVLDFDDDDPYLMVGHPSGPVVSALVALADTVPTSGSEFLAAYVAGVEVEMRLGAGMNPAHYDQGWHATSTLGAVGATVAAARVLGCTPEAVTMAIGTAMSLAGGLRVNFGTMTKPLHVGWAAHAGVYAAQLALGGFTSNPAALEGASGFLAVLGGGASPQRVETELSRLGETWSLLDPGLAIKLYPSCSNTHPALDVLLALRRDHGLTAEGIASVDCYVSPGTETILIHPRPRTGLAAKFSMEYCLSVAILRGAVGIEDFTDAAVLAEDRRAMSERVRMHLDPQIARTGYGVSTASRVVITTTDGRCLTASADGPIGSSTSPIDEARRWQKFLACCEARLGADRAKEAFAAWSQLDLVDDLTTILDLLLPGDPR